MSCVKPLKVTCFGLHPQNYYAVGVAEVSGDQQLRCLLQNLGLARSTADLVRSSSAAVESANAIVGVTPAFANIGHVGLLYEEAVAVDHDGSRHNAISYLLGMFPGDKPAQKTPKQQLLFVAPVPMTTPRALFHVQPPTARPTDQALRLQAYDDAMVHSLRAGTAPNPHASGGFGDVKRTYN